MNVKPGDLAVIVRSNSGNVGRIVEVLSPLGVEPSYAGFRWRLGYSKCQFHWLCRATGRPLSSLQGQSYTEMPLSDCVLRPIRPQADDATDESSAWLPPVPTLETA